jgi:hypothetical protein
MPIWRASSLADSAPGANLVLLSPMIPYGWVAVFYRSYMPKGPSASTHHRGLFVPNGLLPHDPFQHLRIDLIAIGKVADQARGYRSPLIFSNVPFDNSFHEGAAHDVAVKS